LKIGEIRYAISSAIDRIGICKTAYYNNAVAATGFFNPAFSPTSAVQTLKNVSDFEIAIEWLIDSGLIYKVPKVSKPSMPLKSYVDFSAFKIYMIDVGLLGAISELDIDSVITGNDIFTEFKGALTEQYVLQQLLCETKYTPYYYSGEKSTYEVDFLIQKGKDVIPIEVKAEENLKAKSLKVYHDKYQPSFSIRTSMSEYRDQEWMINVPLWAIGSV
jgi:predicted AAA+ superfamily ATPase